jgi:hypothetical protein
MQPYYDDGKGIQIYHGDARDVLPQLSAVDCVITDPVWPNATAELVGSDDPYGLLRDVAELWPRLTRRVVVHLGCDSDPRILCAVPPALPFFRVCWLEYARPGYKGRILYASDVAYVFGEPPPSRPGAHVMPGKYMDRHNEDRVDRGHPCPRRLSHVRWLVNWFARGLVLDPFMGTGTTLVAARHCGLPAIGIEIEERYCDTAARRLEQQAVMDLSLDA